MSYYKLIRKPGASSRQTGGAASAEKGIRGTLYLCTGSGDVPICDTMENADYLVPALIYRVTVTQSPKFRRLLPLLNQVPGRSGIRVHRGTKPEHSKGCILVSPHCEQTLTARWLSEQSAKEETRLEICNNINYYRS